MADMNEGIHLDLDTWIWLTWQQRNQRRHWGTADGANIGISELDGHAGSALVSASVRHQFIHLWGMVVNCFKEVEVQEVEQQRQLQQPPQQQQPVRSERLDQPSAPGAHSSMHGGGALHPHDKLADEAHYRQPVPGPRKCCLPAPAINCFILIMRRQPAVSNGS